MKNVNIGVRNPKEWFITKAGKNVEPSPAENIIRTALNGFNYVFHTEVSFMGLKYETGHFARFDFWFPDLNLLLEYDGKEYHNTEDAKKRDKLKNQFAKTNRIKLIRFNSDHYHQMEEELFKALRERAVRVEKLKKEGKILLKKAKKTFTEVREIKRQKAKEGKEYAALIKEQRKRDREKIEEQRKNFKPTNTTVRFVNGGYKPL